ncbi:MAG: right-handed parallel beta-helix repeat-containing protein [Firmicutes bacterium]|nr:right-handed parallel beta-helix repeat-containing protein [Bacillota bacterium]
MKIRLKHRCLAFFTAICLMIAATTPIVLGEPGIMPLSDPAVLDLYLSPDGSDSADGLSASTALKSVAGANALLNSSPFDGNVVIHIAEGTYQLTANTSWTYAAPGRTISFEGAGEDKTFFTGQTGLDITFLTVNSCGSTSFSFQNFTVSNVRNGIIMRVSNDGSAVTQEGVSGYFSNLTFSCLGGYYTRNITPGVAAIQLLGSSNNVIENCSFIKIRDYMGLNIHGLYISTFSCNNTVRSCLFEDVQPDPVRFRRGSSDNLVEDCTFKNSGTYAYCSEWEAGPAEPEVCSNVVFRNNEMFGGYAGAPIPAIMIFNPGTDQAADADSSRLSEYGNTIHPSTLSTTVPAAVKNYSAVVNGAALSGTIPVYSIDRYEPYLNVDDLAFLLKGTAFEFTSSADADSKTVTLTIGNSSSVSAFSVQADAAEGDLTAERLLEWRVVCGESSNGTMPVFLKDGSYFISLTAVREMMDFQLTVDDSAASITVTTVTETITVPETIQVLKLKFPDSFENKGANNGNYALTDPNNYDIITMNTADLSDIIRFDALIRDGVQYAIVAIPVGTGAYGIREWKNATIKDYYTFADRKWSPASGGYADSFHTTDDEFVYYAIIPVGGSKPSQYPQFRVAKNWTSGSISNYSQFFITDIENYQPLTPVSFDPLNKQCSAAQSLSAGDYTAESWNAAEEALEQAKQLLKNAGASQEAINSAAEALKAALDALVPLGDKTELNRELEQAKQLDVSLYTEASAKRLAEAIADAERVAADANAVQGDINGALEKLSTAVAELELTSGSSAGDSSLPDGTSSSDVSSSDASSDVSSSGASSEGSPLTGGTSALFLFVFAGTCAAFALLLCRQKLDRKETEE